MFGLPVVSVDPQWGMLAGLDQPPPLHGSVIGMSLLLLGGREPLLSTAKAFFAR